MGRVPARHRLNVRVLVPRRRAISPQVRPEASLTGIALLLAITHNLLRWAALTA